MRKVVFALCVVFLFGAVGLSFAEELPTCEELVEIGVVLDDVGDAFGSVDSINEGDELDVALRELVVALQELAEVEQDNRLYSAVNNLVDAYNAMDMDAFSGALKGVDGALGELYHRDCN